MTNDCLHVQCTELKFVECLTKDERHLSNLLVYSKLELKKKVFNIFGEFVPQLKLVLKIFEKKMYLKIFEKKC